MLTPKKYTEKLAAFRAFADMVRAERNEEEAPHKAGVGANRPHVKSKIIWMRITMTSDYFIPV
jgi:hypothetical protein